MILIRVIKRFFRSCSHKIHVLMVIIPVICLYFVVTGTFSTIVNIKSEIYSNAVRLENSKRESIKYIITNRINQAKMQNEFIASTMKEDLSDHDKIILHEDMKSNKITPHVTKILSDTIIYDMQINQIFNTKFTDHILFISNKDGIIDITGIEKGSPVAKFSKWTDIVEKKENKALTENAIYYLIENKSNNLIFWESKKATHQRYQSAYNTPNQMTLMALVDNIPIKDLINYNLLIPVYISFNPENDQDYEFIIVREINVFSILKPFTYDINKYDIIIEEYRYNMNTLLFLSLFVGTIISLLLLGCILLGISTTDAYNKMTRRLRR